MGVPEVGNEPRPPVGLFFFFVRFAPPNQRRMWVQLRLGRCAIWLRVHCSQEHVVLSLPKEATLTRNSLICEMHTKMLRDRVEGKLLGSTWNGVEKSVEKADGSRVTRWTPTCTNCALH